MKQPEEILLSYWGYSSFRPLQKEIIDSVLAGRDCLALLPTGGGKSICYQLPALMKDGLCLVISPLVALMQDQVERLNQIGIEATCLHAGMLPGQVEKVLKEAAGGQYKLLYISPERLQSHLFREYLPEFDVNLIAVDEAHCISQWGYDFRPDYLKIAQLRNVFRKVPLLALTATATKDVEADILMQLRMKGANIFRQSFKRENIFFTVRYSDNKVSDVTDLIRKQSGSMIVYCRSRRNTEVLVKHFTSLGIMAAGYHAGMTKARRDAARASWMNGECKTMVATTAFGMGIDKPDVRAVIHYDAPEHLEAYYQEAGRAGRDRNASKAVLLYNQADINRLRESAAIQFPDETVLRKVYQHVCEYLQTPIGAKPDKYYDFDIADFCSKFQLPVLQTTHAIRLLEAEGLWSISESLFRPATVFITCSRENIDALVRTHQSLGIVITGLLRLYGTLFYYPTPVKLSAVAKQLRVKQDVVHSSLQLLSQMNLLEYNVPREGGHLYFTHTRVNSAHLLIDMQRIRTLRNRHEKRTDAIISFMEQASECRERKLLQYFNETTHRDCGHCDVCLSGYKKPITDKEMRQQILSQLSTPKDLQEIIALFGQSLCDRVTDIVRQLADDEKIVRDVKGFFTITKLPTD